MLKCLLGYASRTKRQKQNKGFVFCPYFVFENDDLDDILTFLSMYCAVNSVEYVLLPAKHCT